LPVGAAAAEWKLLRRTKLRYENSVGAILSKSHIGTRVELEQISMRQKPNTVDLPPPTPSAGPAATARTARGGGVAADSMQFIVSRRKKPYNCDASHPAANDHPNSLIQGFKSPCQETVFTFTARTTTRWSTPPTAAMVFPATSPS
jgi:hypothetical protein